ncbi:unnamed protein product [Protopolystoma xenopodis]|uniref:Uncharacterized protein n=1 Tax=Protopolystoma xenopodis TaxID=117903 RepID=A0A3S5CVL0_9PLAT|nr:unnamed protein product [Protopolystoma xenopodis]
MKRLSNARPDDAGLLPTCRPQRPNPGTAGSIHSAPMPPLVAGRTAAVIYPWMKRVHSKSPSRLFIFLWDRDFYSDFCQKRQFEVSQNSQRTGQISVFAFMRCKVILYLQQMVTCRFRIALQWIDNRSALNNVKRKLNFCIKCQRIHIALDPGCKFDIALSTHQQRQRGSRPGPHYISSIVLPDMHDFGSKASRFRLATSRGKMIGNHYILYNFNHFEAIRSLMFVVMYQFPSGQNCWQLTIKLV